MSALPSEPPAMGRFTLLAKTIAQVRENGGTPEWIAMRQTTLDDFVADVRLYPGEPTGETRLMGLRVELDEGMAPNAVIVGSGPVRGTLGERRYALDAYFQPLPP